MSNCFAVSFTKGAEYFNKIHKTSMRVHLTCKSNKNFLCGYVKRGIMGCVYLNTRTVVPPHWMKLTQNSTSYATEKINHQ